MKIGVLGGTFDPIHQGHLALAGAAQKQFYLDKVFFVPALIPPHKTQRRDITPAPYRYRMVELAMKGRPGFEISDVEFDRPEVSYTVETLRALKKRYPSGTFFLVVGADTVRDMPGWKEAEEIKKLATILAAPRPGYPIPSGKGIQVVEMPEIDLSSSEIREKLAMGEHLGKTVLPEETEAYLHKMRLYCPKKIS